MHACSAQMGSTSVIKARARLLVFHSDDVEVALHACLQCTDGIDLCDQNTSTSTDAISWHPFLHLCHASVAVFATRPTTRRQRCSMGNALKEGMAA